MINFLFILLEEKYFTNLKVIEVNILEITNDYIRMKVRVASNLDIKYNMWCKKEIKIKDHIKEIRDYKLEKILK